MINSRNLVVDNEEEEGAEEDWGIVSLDGEIPPENETSGELILSGVEADEASSFHENNPGYPAFDDISIPGTDSIPSEIDTLDIASGLNVNLAGSDATWRPDDEEQSANPAHSTTRSFKKIHVILLFFALVLMTMVSYLSWERHSWRMAHMLMVEEKLRLEEENRQLKEAAEKAAKNAPPPPTKSSSSCNANDAWQYESEDAVLADNCYFRLTLRDCGKNAKESWNDLTNGVYSSLDYFGKMAWNAVVWQQQEEDSGPPTTTTTTKLMNSMATEAFSEASDVVASTMVAVNHALLEVSESTRVAVTNVFYDMTNVFHEMSKVVDESILRVVNLTRDVIDDATVSTRPE